MDYALYVVVAACLAAGIMGAVLRGWSIHSRLYSLEDRVGVVEGTLTREVKIRAAQSRPPRGQADESLFKELSGKPVQVAPPRVLNWWEKLGAAK
jgi:hypothetical protein